MGGVAGGFSMVSLALTAAAVEFLGSVSTLTAGAVFLFSVTTVAVLIVLSLGTKVAPKWAEKRVFYCGNTAQNITLWLSYAISVQNSLFDS